MTAWYPMTTLAVLSLGDGLAVFGLCIVLVAWLFRDTYER